MHDVLATGGTAVLEVHYAGAILDGLQYDSIYHEHLCYFSYSSLKYLLEKHGLYPYHVEFGPISGGSLIVFAARSPQALSAELLQVVAMEAENGIKTLAAWQRFAETCREHRAHFNRWAHCNASRIIGYGASARSSTFLNYCGIDHAFLECIIDNNPMKQGTFSPGGAIPIVSFEEGLSRQPEIIFILAWNFTEEIKDQCRQKGYTGEFICAFPWAGSSNSN